MAKKKIEVVKKVAEPEVKVEKAVKSNTVISEEINISGGKTDIKG